jgi:hypothetical protein
MHEFDSAGDASERTDFALAAPIVVSPRVAGPTSAAAFACFKQGIEEELCRVAAADQMH